MANVPDFVIDTLRGGMNDEDPENFIADDECVYAMNVEFWDSTLGERRRGFESIDITDSDLDDEDAIINLVAHMPNTLTDVVGPEVPNELWAVGITIGTSTTFARREDNTWSVITPVDAPDLDYHLSIASASYHDKLWYAYKSGVDRMHLWDGDTLRRAGIAAPADPPVVADSGGAGSFSGDRTYRVRFGTIDGDGNITRVSEPSEDVVFTPSGSNDGAVITVPADDPDEGATHWSVEADDGTGNFYFIAVQDLSTTTYTDTVADPGDYAAGILAPDIGDYSLIPSAKYIKIDEDRLIFAGSYEDEEAGSRIWWTPVFAAPGYMNDERIPLDTNNFMDLDWQSGGTLTGLSDPVDGSFYAFKLSHIYKVQRTGLVDRAYESFLLTNKRGAIKGSIVNGIDEFGRGCVYFLDPAVGPCRISSAGLQRVRGMGGTWKHINAGADHVAVHGVYYPDKEQIHWWICYEHAETPNLKLVLQTSETRSQDDVAHRGWSQANGDIASAWCSTIVPEVVLDEDGARRIAHTIYIGGRTGLIGRCDTTDTDDETEYVAHIKTKPYMPAGLLNQWGGMEAGLLAEPIDDENVTIDIKMTRDFGRETNTVVTDFVPVADESVVIKIFDNLKMSEARAIQFEFKDTE